MFYAHRLSSWPNVLIVALIWLSVVAFASEPDDGLGKADVEPNRVSGHVLLADGQPANHAKLSLIDAIDKLK